jgi:hypothetical protein
MGRVKENVMECNYELLCVLGEMCKMAHDAYEQILGIDVADFNRLCQKAVFAGTYWHKVLFGMGANPE